MLCAVPLPQRVVLHKSAPQRLTTPLCRSCAAPCVTLAARLRNVLPSGTTPSSRSLCLARSGLGRADTADTAADTAATRSDSDWSSELQAEAAGPAVALAQSESENQLLLRLTPGAVQGTPLSVDANRAAFDSVWRALSLGVPGQALEALSSRFAAASSASTASIAASAASVASVKTPPFLPLVQARSQLRVASAWLSSLARRLRSTLLHARSVSLQDRAASLAFLREDPSVAAQVAALARMPFERAVGILATMDAMQRDRLLAGLDAAARAGELATRPARAAARELASIPPRARAAVLQMMPRLTAAAALRAMKSAVRSETWSAMAADARGALSVVMRSCE